MKLILQIAVGLVIGVVLLSVVCGVCMTGGSSPDKYTVTPIDISKLVRVEVIRISESGGYVTAQAKCENISGRFISQVAGSIVLCDAAGKDLAADNGYFVYSHKGGIAPGATVYQDFLFSQVDYSRVSKYRAVVTGVQY